MVKIDLITGFLGSGKTTFIKKYAKYLIDRGIKVGIVVNDYGPVNIDRVLLGELEGDMCRVEMVTTGLSDDPEAHSRRFRTKLISLKMQGYQRILVEPSGIYDIHEFFDCLYDEPLDSWYEPGSVITVVDADLEQNLSYETEHYLASQISVAGKVVLSRCDTASEDAQESTKNRIKDILYKMGSPRQLTEDDIITKDWEYLDEADFDMLAECGYVSENRITPLPDAQSHFNTFFYTDFIFHSKDEIRNKVQSVFEDNGCGRVLRIKGFIRIGDETLELNATHDTITLEVSPAPVQQVIIVTGEKLKHVFFMR